MVIAEFSVDNEFIDPFGRIWLLSLYYKSVMAKVRGRWSLRDVRKIRCRCSNAQEPR